MRKSKFTEEQMAYALKQAELGISSATFYKWRQKYAGVGPSELRRMHQLEVTYTARQLRRLSGMATQGGSAAKILAHA